jgi:hypothetical protein
MAEQTARAGGWSANQRLYERKGRRLVPYAPRAATGALRSFAYNSSSVTVLRTTLSLANCWKIESRPV